MAKGSSIYLEDILAAILQIEEYTNSTTLDALSHEPMRQDAVIRQMEIIGEAANHLPIEFLEQYPDFPVREAVVMRNFLIHDYNNVQIETVWQTMLEDLPLLKQQVIKIIK